MIVPLALESRVPVPLAGGIINVPKIKLRVGTDQRA
jgi:hypothetical protein